MTVPIWMPSFKLSYHPAPFFPRSRNPQVLAPEHKKNKWPEDQKILRWAYFEESFPTESAKPELQMSLVHEGIANLQDTSDAKEEDKSDTAIHFHFHLSSTIEDGKVNVSSTFHLQGFTGLMWEELDMAG
ncbi:hypothetical protein BDR04DRAFT_1117525 [Suillus decipiens]|nr:hypothetical protein BDR04DRAFT_1117525 [Suillus decipiens]